MTEEEKPRWVFPHLPENTDILTALGEVTLRHAYLDHMLKWAVMHLAELEGMEAASALEYEGSAALRDLIRKLAARRFGRFSPTTLKAKALVNDCELVTLKRNRFVHGEWVYDTEVGTTMALSAFRTEHLPVPDANELRELASRILELATRWRTAVERGGFLREALNANKAKASVVALKGADE